MVLMCWESNYQTKAKRKKNRGMTGITSTIGFKKA